MNDKIKSVSKQGFMIWSFLKAAIILTLFRHQYAAEDLLQYYHPDPRLPEELNKWLSIVQDHSNDFRLIREAVESSKKERRESDREQKIKTEFKREFHNLFDESYDESYFPEDGLSNDIYPYMYREKKAPIRPSRTFHNLQINNAGATGEISRLAEKYPDRYHGYNNPNKKREIEIDILNDGQLIKKINDDQKQSKSFVFNIEGKNEVKPQNNLGITGQNKNNAVASVGSIMVIPSSNKIPEIEVPQQRSLYDEGNNKDKDELNNNFKNLFNANEHLNTDASIFKEDPLVYRVTLPDINAFLHSTVITTENTDPNRNNFNKNGLQDLSPFWTGTEKQIMQKGIDFAQRFSVGGGSSEADSKTGQNSEKEGFEEVKSVMLDDSLAREHKPEADNSNFQQQPLKEHQDLNEVAFRTKFQENAQQEKPGYGTVEIQFDSPNVDSKSSGNSLFIKEEEPMSSFNKRQNKNNLLSKRDINPPCDKLEEAINSNPLAMFNPSENKLTLSDSPMVNPPENSGEGNLILQSSGPEINDSPNKIDMFPSNENNNDIFGATSEKQDCISGDCNSGFDADLKPVVEAAPPPWRKAEITNAAVHATPHTHAGNAQQKEEEGEAEESEMEPMGGVVVEVRPVGVEEYEELGGGGGDEGVGGGGEESQTFHEPVTKKIKSVIEEHKVITKIETVTVIDHSKDEGGELCEEPMPPSPRKPYSSESGGRQRFSDQRFKLVARPFIRSNKERRLTSKFQENESKVKKLEKIRKHTGNHVKHHHHRKEQYTKFSKKHRLKGENKLKHHNNLVGDDVQALAVPSQKTIPTFAKRQLKEATDYEYDPNLGYPDLEESFKDFKEKKEATSNGPVHKDSVDEYNDEEDSNEKNTEASKIIKKTHNEYANPDTTPEEVQDYYSDYDSSLTKDSDNESQEDHDENNAVVGKKLHKKKKTSDKKKVSPKPKPTSKPKPAKSSQSKTFLENSDFQQWPNFVRNDHAVEEVLKKRSLINQQKNNVKRYFPLSTKTFFVKKPPHDRAVAEAPPSSTGKAETNGLTLQYDSSMAADVEAPLGNNQLMINVNINASKENDNINNDVNSNNPPNNLTTTEESCGIEPQVKITSVCEDDSMFSRTEYVMTTALPIVPDAESFSASYYEPWEKVDELLNGRIAFYILDQMFQTVNNKENFRKRFRYNLKRTRDPKMFEGVREASERESRKIVKQMSDLIAKLQITTNCALLPSKLRFYLKSITKNKKGTALEKSRNMEEIEPDENQNQGAEGKPYVFESGITPDNLEEKVNTLKNLLNKFQSLPEQCKPRALPVKEYIENHLGMLDKILSPKNIVGPNGSNLSNGPGGSTASSSSSGGGAAGASNSKLATEVKQNLVKRKNPSKADLMVGNENNEISLIEKQLDSVGLGKNPNFRPKFDLNELIEKNRHKKSLFDDEDDEDNEEENEENVGTSEPALAPVKTVSKKFNKLYKAIQREKRKRSREKRLGQIYGKLIDEEGMYDAKSKREVKDSFESPMVYSF